MAKERTPLTDTGIQKKIVAAAVKMIDWTHAPLVKRLGLNMENTLQMQNWPPGGSKKVEWLEDSMAPLSTTLAAAIGDTTTLSIQITNPTYLHSGHIIKVGTEYMVVAAVDEGGTVTLGQRGFGGSTAATHSNAAAVTIEGIAKKHGDNVAIGYTTTISLPYNYTQVLEESVEVALGQQIASDYGVSDTAAYHLAKLIGGNSAIGGKGRAGTLIIQLGKMAYNSYRQALAAATPRAAAGGLDTFISTNTTGDTSTAMGRPAVHAQLRAIYNAGGVPDLILTSPWGAEKFSQMYEDKYYTTRNDSTGGRVVNRIDTPVATGIEVLIDWQCPTTKTYILDSARVGWATVRPFMARELPQLTDSVIYSVLGEYTFCLCNETAHALITHSATK